MKSYPVRLVCAWCKKLVARAVWKSENPPATEATSHVICSECLQRIMPELPSQPVDVEKG